VNQILAGPRPKPTDPTVIRDQQVMALVRAWNRAGDDARQLFLDGLAEAGGIMR
jgi:hypothetical protein